MKMEKSLEERILQIERDLMELRKSVALLYEAESKSVQVMCALEATDSEIIKVLELVCNGSDEDASELTEKIIRRMS